MTDVVAETVLPKLDSDYPVKPAEIASFQSNGHVVLRGVASAAEITAYEPALTATVRAHNPNQKKLEDRDTYGKAFIQIGNLWKKDAVCRKFVFARRFAKIAADLMGVRDVRLYHDQALYKEAHGGFTPLHQDQFYWPLDTPNTITMWMPLVDASAEMGTMHFASGSYRGRSVGNFEISDTSEQIFRDHIHSHNYPLTSTGAMRAGDATFHYGWTIHGAPVNSTDRMRNVMTIIYFADGARVSEPKNTPQSYDLKFWLPGLKPGDIAATELNPLLYER